jgi:methionine synthase I (cobalamin-dependent)
MARRGGYQPEEEIDKTSKIKPSPGTGVVRTDAYSSHNKDEEIYALRSEISALAKRNAKLTKRLQEQEKRSKHDADRWYMRGQSAMRDAICAELFRQELTVAAKVAQSVDVKKT